MRGDRAVPVTICYNPPRNIPFFSPYYLMKPVIFPMEAAMTSKRLYKSRTERMIDGVCGGIAEYLGLDVTLIRIVWVLLTLFGGTGIVLYIVAMIVMPTAPARLRCRGKAAHATLPWSEREILGGIADRFRHAFAP